jgi:HEAT repeat protein
MVLLDKGGASLKAFVPQLQTTFVKALNDPARDVRARGATALGRLMPLSLRVDPLLTELTQLCTRAESTAIKVSVLDAITTVLNMGGNKATPPALEACKSALVKALYEEDDGVRSAAAVSLSKLVWFLDASAVTDTALDLLDSAMGPGADWTQVCGKILGLGAVLQGAGQQLQDVREEAFLALLSACRDDRSTVNAAAAK